MNRIASIEQDGFTTCVIDTRGTAHCFRIDTEIGAELAGLAQDLALLRRDSFRTVAAILLAVGAQVDVSPLDMQRADRARVTRHTNAFDLSESFSAEETK